MYLLYTDESGSIDDPNGDFFVLAGCALFERQTHWVDSKLESIADRFNRKFETGKCELHGSPMYGGSDGWKQAATVPERVQAVCDALNLLDHEHGKIFVFVSVRYLHTNRILFLLHFRKLLLHLIIILEVFITKIIRKINVAS